MSVLHSAAFPAIVTAFVATSVGVIVSRSLKVTIEEDVRALLPEVAVRLVRLSGKLLKLDDRAEVLAWFMGEFASVRRKGGSGVGVAAMFLVIVVHRAVITRLVRVRQRP